MTTGQAVANVREGLGATLNFLLLFSFFLTLVFFFILPFSSVVTAIAGKGGWHLVQIGATLIAAFPPLSPPPLLPLLPQRSAGAVIAAANASNPGLFSAKSGIALVKSGTLGICGRAFAPLPPGSREQETP